MSFHDNDLDKVHCDNCEWIGTAGNLLDIDDLGQRLDAGGVVPAGQCPECNALAYLDAPPTWARLNQRLYVILEGGLVAGVCADDPTALAGLTVQVIDYDTEGADIRDCIGIPQADKTIAPACSWCPTIEALGIGPVPQPGE